MQLTHAEEAATVHRYQKLVRFFVGSYAKWWPQVPRKDLEQEGNIGLLEAIRAYDPNRGTKLSTYAAYHIRKALSRYTANNWSVVNLPRDDAYRALFVRLRHPNLDEAKIAALANEYEIPVEDVVRLNHYIRGGDMSHDNYKQIEGGENMEWVSCSDYKRDPWEATEAAERASMGGWVATKARAFMGQLDKRDATLFRRRFLDEATYLETAKELGVSAPRVAQLEDRLRERFIEFVLKGGEP